MGVVADGASAAAGPAERPFPLAPDGAFSLVIRLLPGRADPLAWARRARETGMSPGYHRFPTLHRDRLVFVSEDDLWAVPAAGGIARRLTANLGAVSAPFFSPDGATLAFTGRE